MNKNTIALSFIGAAAVACASSGTKPHDMSQAGHEQAGRKIASRGSGVPVACAEPA